MRVEWGLGGKEQSSLTMLQLLVEVIPDPSFLSSAVTSHLSHRGFKSQQTPPVQGKASVGTDHGSGGIHTVTLAAL